MVFSPSIGPNEEIKLIGSYDRSIVNVQQISGYPGGNLGQITNIVGLCGPSFMSVNYVVSKTGLIGGPTYADETYSLVSYPEDNKLPKLGSIIWSGTYRESLSESGFTAPSVQEFPVTGASGIYSGVNRVIVDYNNIVRVVYFVGPKQM